ncbi:RNA-directed DNA polymerase, eukaryota [Tanacetum coccineum]
MHGNHGALSSCITSLRRSSWLDIIREMHALNSKGIDLMQFLKKKLVKSTRICIDDNILPKNDVPTRWVKIIPIKVNIHAWKVFLDKLPTRLNLSLRGMDIPSILCPLCNSAAESTSHIFFSCPLARQVWNKFLRWWEMDSISFDRYEDWLSWLNNTRFPKQLKTFLEGICYIMWWLIWRFRNQVLFGSKQPRRDLLFDDIVQLSYLWISNRSPC